MQAQYVDKAGLIQIDRIIEALDSFELYSLEQTEKIQKIRSSLARSISSVKHLPDSTSIIMNILKCRGNLMRRVGPFSHLKPDPKIEQDAKAALIAADTISARTHQLVYLNKMLLDSQKVIKDALVKLIEDETESRASKEIAVRMLIDNGGVDVTSYIFKHHKKLEFFNFNDPLLVYNFNQDGFPKDRTALWHYFIKSGAFSRDKLARNWSALPFIIQYFGENPNSWKGYSMEELMLSRLVIDYKHPWLITDFVYENMQDKTSRVAQLYKTIFDDKRAKFENAKLNTKGHD